MQYEIGIKDYNDETQAYSEMVRLKPFGNKIICRRF